MTHFMSHRAPNEIKYLINLKLFIIFNNQIKIIPNSIIYCKNLYSFNYNNNQIKNISSIVTRFLNKL